MLEEALHYVSPMLATCADAPTCLQNNKPSYLNLAEFLLIFDLGHKLFSLLDVIISSYGLIAA
jgi:hypothetical protein